MKLQFSTLAGTTALMGAAALLILLTGCDTEGSGRVTLYGGSTGYAQSSVSFEDDYDYYPGYEVYYSRNRREYVYRDGDQWVRRSEPRDVSINVLLAMPSIRLDFHDSPERHHDNVVRSYPRNWHRSSPSVQVQAVVSFEDDYDYYPDYEVYYSRNRREYVYRDGNQWVRRSEPRGVSLNVLLSTPSVRLDFHDSPERHHDNVVRSYPRESNRQDNRQVNRQDNRQDERQANRQDAKDDRRNDKNDRKDEKKHDKKDKKDRKHDDKDDRKDDDKNDNKDDRR